MIMESNGKGYQIVYKRRRSGDTMDQEMFVTAEDMIFDRSRRRESLNGSWHYAVDQYGDFLRVKWYEEKYYDEKGNLLPVNYSFDEWDRMELPCSYNVVKPELKLYEGPMDFTRKFHYQPLNEGEKVFLKVGACNYLLRVYLNKKYVGTHRGGSTPAYFDVTEFLERENRIHLYADSTRREEQVPTLVTDWFNYGGVYRDIEIIRVPKLFIKDFRVVLVPDGGFDKIRVNVTFSESVDTTAVFALEELGISEEIAVSGGKGEAIINAKPELWSPEHPKLYEVSLSLRAMASGSAEAGSGSAAAVSFEQDLVGGLGSVSAESNLAGGSEEKAEAFSDRVWDRVGFRQIEVKGMDILLNGEPIYLKGISMHEDDFLHGKALTDEDRLENVKNAKEMGCNYMRLVHYPHSEKMARLCDEMGVLLWEEVPVYWGIRFDLEDTWRDAENQLLELIGRDYNRASVIIWSVGNENADTDERLKFMGDLADKARENDPTRPVSAACLVNFAKNRIEDRLEEKLDIIGLNEYCGWYEADWETLPALFENSKPKKPVIITEFGADARANLRGTVTEKGTEDCQAYVYEQQTAHIAKISYIKGMTPWILNDFRCPNRTSHYQRYFNTKGLISSDRSHKKLAYYVLKKFYESK